MSGLGKMLQEARRQRGLTLDDAERETHIRKRYLLAWEQEEFDALPSPVYAVGFLRIYARYLDLDADPLVTQFTERTGATVHPQPLTQSPLAQPSRVQAVARRRTALAPVVLVLASAVATFLFFQVVRGPAAAAWSSLRQVVVMSAQEMPFPFLADWAASRPDLAPSEAAGDRAGEELRVPSPSPPASGNGTAGGGDQQPATADIPKVIMIPPWFLPPQPAQAAAPGAKMPTVLGQPAEEARSVLEGAGLAVATEQWWSREVPAGMVVYQQPLPQEPLPQGQPAVIVVSRGPLRVVVPDLLGRRQDEALRLLQQAGLLNAPVIHYPRSRDLSSTVRNTVCNGCVLESVPGPGAEVPPEGVVTLSIRKE
ncbi:MAG: helix-turn-helix domain-containing protein [Chloroflexi bacterium]|nr:helix-turn-helix domain-containing protein [Chloroflexota bacterium]